MEEKLKKYAYEKLKFIFRNRDRMVISVKNAVALKRHPCENFRNHSADDLFREFDAISTKTSKLSASNRSFIISLFQDAYEKVLRTEEIKKHTAENLKNKE